MEKFCISIYGASVRYISDIPLQEYYVRNKEFMEFFNANVIPDTKDVIYTVIYHDIKKEPILSFTENTMTIHYPFSELNESILLYMGYHYLEKQFGQLGLCSCHSACIAKEGEATLLIGEAGAGKTSLAVNMCEKFGFSLISNDMTLIGLEDDQLKAFGGTKFLNLRMLSVKQNMPFLLYLFNNDNNDKWTNKISIMARELGIYEEYDILPIKNILFVHVDNREEQIKVSNGDSWRNNFLLYQNLSSHIRGNAATFIDNKGHPIDYIPPFESKLAYDKRKEMINLINTNPNYYYINGNLESAIDFINTLYDNEKVLKKE